MVAVELEDGSGVVSKLFQITEEDLAGIEADIPAILQRHYPCMTPADKCAFRRVQQVLMDVRWNYGPPTEVKVIPASDEESDEATT